MTDDLGAVHPLGRERTVEQALARELRAAILAGRLPPGTRLPYRELATKFEVSITPVRIALRELAQEGLVLTRPHEGARVAPLSGAELEEIYAARSGFEGWLAHQGAPRLGDAALREMDRCLATLERAAAANDLRAYLDAGWAHRGVCYLAAGRPAMLARTEALYQRAARYNWLTLTGEGRLGESLGVARELHGACAARDGRRARALVRAALDQTMEHLVDRFADLETESAHQCPTSRPGGTDRCWYPVNDAAVGAPARRLRAAGARGAGGLRGGRRGGGGRRVRRAGSRRRSRCASASCCPTSPTR